VKQKREICLLNYSLTGFSVGWTQWTFWWTAFGLESCKDDFYAYLTPAGILLEGLVKDLNKSLKLLNCYGPYSDREAFWETLKKDGLFNEHNLVMGGDLNFTTSCREVWGEIARVDPLHIYFSH
jgi:hypothetical protein